MNFVSGQWPWAPCHTLWYNLERARRWGACWKIFNVAKGKESYWNGKICQSTEKNQLIQAQKAMIRLWGHSQTLCSFSLFPRDLCFLLCWISFGTFQQRHRLLLGKSISEGRNHLLFDSFLNIFLQQRFIAMYYVPILTDAVGVAMLRLSPPFQKS